jgi:hypothetical protein
MGRRLLAGRGLPARSLTGQQRLRLLLLLMRSISCALLKVTSVLLVLMAWLAHPAATAAESSTMAVSAPAIVAVDWAEAVWLVTLPPATVPVAPAEKPVGRGVEPETESRIDSRRSTSPTAAAIILWAPRSADRRAPGVNGVGVIELRL